jgi:hypothetical protein
MSTTTNFTTTAGKKVLAIDNTSKEEGYVSFEQISNQRLDKIIPATASGNFVVSPAVDVPTEINPDGRAIWKKTYSGNFSGPTAVTALAADEAYLVNITHHYRVTSGAAVPGIVRARVDFLAGGLNPINNSYDSQDSEDMTSSSLLLNTDQTVSKYYYGDTALSYFQQEMILMVPDSTKTTYPTITIEEQKMEIVVYIIKKNVMTAAVTLY